MGTGSPDRAYRDKVSYLLVGNWTNAGNVGDLFYGLEPAIALPVVNDRLCQLGKPWGNRVQLSEL